MRGSERAQPTTIELGTLVDGRYRVERLLGEGGMGVVYAVRDPAGAELALKIVLDASNEEMRKRFIREAQAAGALVSEHATRVYASGTLDDGAPYMVMELLTGQDLHDHLLAHGPLGVDDAIDVIKQVGDALGEAHELGLVHRDVKPANVFVRARADGRLVAKLIDFGVSKTALTELAPVTQLTQMGTILGSPHYMSPEQLVSSSDVDARADIWSLGATFHELLTGVGPFAGNTVAEVVSAVLRDPPHSLRAQHPEIPAALERVVLRCLKKDREKRFSSVAEMVQALDDARPQPPVVVSRPEPVRRTPVPASSARAPLPVPFWQQRWLWALAAAVVVAAALTVWMMGRAPEPGIDITLGPSDDFAAADLKLDDVFRQRVAKDVRTAFGKLQMKNYAAATELAVSAEAMIVDKGLVPGTDASRLAQDAAIVQARVSAEQAITHVQKAGKDDDPASVIGEVKSHLSREAEDAERAASWDPTAPRCIRSAPLFTHVKVLDEWQQYVKRVDPTRLRVAENYTATLSLGVRAMFDTLLHPSAGLSEPCRLRVETERRAFTSR